MVTCELVFQPVIRLIQVVVSIVEYILVQVCHLIQEVVSVITQVLEWICNTVAHTVCGAVCSVICGICDFFCGIFGCDCGCENVCNNVCRVVTDVVCGLTWIIRTVLELVTSLVCDFILQAIIHLLNLIEAIVTMVLTWICTFVDIGIRWFFCWTHLAEIFDDTDPRRLKVAPKIVPNNQGHSDWFVYVNNPNSDGVVDQNLRGYILSDKGRPLVPVVDRESQAIAYYEVETRGDLITGVLKQDEGDPVQGNPFLYYPYKVIEIGSHLFGDVFASRLGDDGRGTDYHDNLLTYAPNVQDLLSADGKLPGNNYNAWSGKYTSLGRSDYFGDGSIPDMGLRVDTDATCSHPTNTFLHLVGGSIQFTPGNSAVAETMSCGAGQALTFDQTNFLLLNKDAGASAITTYLVSKFNADDTSVGCAFLLGYTVVTFDSGSTPIFVTARVLPFEADRNRMMARIVENLSGHNQDIVRVAETYLHECGHQCGLLHDTDTPDCEDDTTLHIAKVMDPGGSIRRAFTRLEWCMVRTSGYVTSDDLEPFTQAPELPDSESRPAPPVE